MTLKGYFKVTGIGNFKITWEVKYENRLNMENKSTYSNVHNKSYTHKLFIPWLMETAGNYHCCTLISGNLLVEYVTFKINRQVYP